MAVYFASIQKELRLLARNLHALAVLFVMPLAFVLIMSLALQDQVEGRSGVTVEGVINKKIHSDLSVRFEQQLALNAFIVLRPKSDKSVFELTLKPNFDEVIEGEFEGQSAVSLSFSPALGLRERHLILAAVKESFAVLNARVMAEDLGFDDQYVEASMLKSGAVSSEQSKAGIVINATQQNVPAWLVFAMFFISLPIATVVLYERRQKTLLRLRSMGLDSHQWLIAKLLPYVVINGVQFGFLLLVGVHIVPMFGGAALSLSVSWPALLLMALSVSISAIGFASLVACVCRSGEQATIIVGTSNILFGAIGGIMVPKFVMPTFMHNMVYFSPMGWGLEGFLGVLAFGDGITGIWLEALVLTVFGLCALVLANTVLKRRVI